MVNSDKLVNLFRPVVATCGLEKYYNFVFGGSNQVGDFCFCCLCFFHFSFFVCFFPSVFVLFLLLTHFLGL